MTTSHLAALLATAILVAALVAGVYLALSGLDHIEITGAGR